MSLKPRPVYFRSLLSGGFVITLQMLGAVPVRATTINIVDPSFTHFADFVNEAPAPLISAGRISSHTAAAV